MNNPDWKGIASLVVMALGWAYTLGIAREQLKANTEDIAAHSKVAFHEGVRSLTEATAKRVTDLEIRSAVINEKLDRILAIVEKNHG